MKESKRPAQKGAYEQESQETPQILSSDEKRQLILAHARSQTSKDPLQRMTVWGGVMIAVAGIAVGWWWTVGQGIRNNLNEGIPELNAMTETLNRFSQTVEENKSALRQPYSPTNQADAAEFSGMMKAVLEGDSAGEERGELFAPRPIDNPANTTTTIDANTVIDTDIQLIDPETPGLETDPN